MTSVSAHHTIYQIIKINLEIVGSSHDLKFKEADILKEVSLESTIDHEIIAQSIASELKIRGYDVDNTELFYYSYNYNIYIKCGSSPISRSVLISEFDIRDSTINIRLCYKQYFLDEKETKEKRRIETIKEMVKVVNDWRKLYQGTIIKEKKVVKYSLVDAAKMVGLRKKTLDDYLQQLRMGKRYGFNFNKHKEEKMRVLRNYIKEHKPKNKPEDSNMDKKEENEEINQE